MAGIRPSAAIAHSPASGFRADVFEGLSRRQKSLPAKYFYDERGSVLFDEITRLPEYYLCRAESEILAQRASDIAELGRDRAALVEFGSGSFRKALLILQASPWISTYIPCDISGEFLETQQRAIRSAYPRLNVVPAVADFTQAMRLPAAVPEKGRMGLFLGSTIGNFDPAEARAIFANFARILGPSALLLVGADIVKDAATLERAYDDSQGVTAQFNLNLLARINRELSAEFDLSRFAHRAVFDQSRSRIEMHLVSRCDQVVRVDGRAITFRAGETIHTENSYKYTPASFAALARAAGWRTVQSWRDAQGLFSVHALRLAD